MVPEHTPTDVAHLLGIASGTLRKWSVEFAGILSAPASVSGPKVRRRYNDSDMLLLQRAQALLNHGATYDQVRTQLSTFADNAPIVELDKQFDFGQIDNPQSLVTVLDERPEVEALRVLLDAQRSTLEAQRATLEAQGQLIAQLQHEREQDRQTVSQVRQQSTIDKAVLTAQLEQANSQAAEALAAIQGTLGRIPRWLRALLGLGA